MSSFTISLVSRLNVNYINKLSNENNNTIRGFLHFKGHRTKKLSIRELQLNCFAYLDGISYRV